MRTTGIGTSIFLIAAGAVLAWAVTAEVEGVDLSMVGVILLVVGIVGFVASLILGAADGHTIVERDREVYVDRERV